MEEEGGKGVNHSSDRNVPNELEKCRKCESLHECIQKPDLFSMCILIERPDTYPYDDEEIAGELALARKEGAI